MGIFDIFKKKKVEPLTAEERWNRIWECIVGVMDVCTDGSGTSDDLAD